MNTMILTVLTTFIFLMRFTYAGQGSGNGGGAWACIYKKQIVWVKLIDIWEAQNKYRQNSNPQNYFSINLGDKRNSNILLQNALNKLSNQVSKELAQQVRIEIDTFKAKRLPVSKDAQLSYIEDATLSHQPNKESCLGEIKLVQIVRYVDNGTIEYDQRLLSFLSNIEIAALDFHEGYYAVRRDSPYFDTTSDKTREATAVAFSNQSFHEADSAIFENSKTPSAVFKDKRINSVEFYCIYVERTKEKLVIKVKYNDYSEIEAKEGIYWNTKVAKQLEDASKPKLKTCEERKEELTIMNPKEVEVLTNRNIEKINDYKRNQTRIRSKIDETYRCLYHSKSTQILVKTVLFNDGSSKASEIGTYPNDDFNLWRTSCSQKKSELEKLWALAQAKMK